MPTQRPNGPGRVDSTRPALRSFGHDEEGDVQGVSQAGLR